MYTTTKGHRRFCKDFLRFDTVPCRHLPLHVHTCALLMSTPKHKSHKQANKQTNKQTNKQ